MNLLDLSVKVGLKDEASDKIEGISTSAIAKASAIGHAMYDAAKFVGGQAVSMVKEFAGGVISGYGQFEQMEGGIKKLFGDASDTVIANSKRAFREAGMSQTQYLQSSTSLAASLIKSLGGDMEAAAERNAVAMKAIADNADTFGTSVEDVTMVYSSLSRGMYQTLDNLRLGYAGTKEGMQNLINDANTYAESIGETSGMTIDSFADIVRAIDLIQQKQGIAGTTMKEALTTIEGSVRMAKNSWQDFMTAVGSGDTDRIRETMQGIRVAIFGTWDEDQDQMVGGVIRNIMPVFQRAIEAVADELPALASSLAFGVGEMIANAMNIDTVGIESTQELGRRLVEGIVQGISDVSGLDFSSILNKLTETIDVSAIIDGFSSVGTAILDFWNSLTETLDLGNVNVAIESLGNIVSNVWGFIEQNVLPHASELGEIIGTVGNVLMEAGNSVLNLFEALSPFLPVILGAVAAVQGFMIVQQLIGFFTTFGSVIGTVSTVIGTFGGPIAAIAAALGGWPVLIVAVIGGIVALIASSEDAREFIGNAIQAIGQFFSDLWASAVESFNGIVESVKQTAADSVAQWEQMKADAAAKWQEIQESIAQALIGIVNWVLQKWAQVKQSTSDAWNAVLSTLSSIGSSIISTVQNAWNLVVTTVATALTNTYNRVLNGWGVILSYVTSIPSKIKSALSNVGDTLYSVGQNIIDGLKRGISSSIGSVASTILSGMKGAVDTVKSFLGIASPSKLFKTFGEFTMEGFAIGVTDMTEKAVKAVREASGAIYDAASGTISIDGAQSFSAMAPAGAVGFGDSYTVYLNVEDRNDFNGMALAFVDAVQSVKRNNGRASSMNVRMV